MTLDRPAQPPKGWRKAIPKAVKLAVRERQKQCCAICGERLLPKIAHALTEFDHRPALTARGWDGADTIPAANDPAFIEALHVACHRVRTKADISTRAKTIRRQKAEDAFQAALAGKSPGKKRTPKGSIRSRNNLRKENRRGG